MNSVPLHPDMILSPHFSHRKSFPVSSGHPRQEMWMRTLPVQSPERHGVSPCVTVATSKPDRER